MRISDWSSDVCSSGRKEVVMSHRLFAQLAFERALGNAAIEALAAALNDKDHFDAESMLPKDPMFIGKTSADIEAVAAELGQIIEERIKDEIGRASGQERVCQNV